MARVPNGACRLPGGNRRYSSILVCACCLKIMAMKKARCYRPQVGCRKRPRRGPTRPSSSVRAAKAALKRARKLFKAEKKSAKQARKKLEAAAAATRPPSKAQLRQPAGARQTAAVKAPAVKAPKKAPKKAPHKAPKKARGFPQTAPRAQTAPPAATGSYALGLRCRKIGHREPAKSGPQPCRRRR